MLSFLWDVPCGGLRFWLVESLFGDTLFKLSNFWDWEVCYGVGSTHRPGFGFTIACWQTRLEFVYPVCFLS